MLPVLPLLVLLRAVHQPHVEEGGEDKCEKSDRGASNQVKKRSKIRKTLCYKQKEENHRCSECASFPIESYNERSFKHFWAIWKLWISLSMTKQSLLLLG